MVKSTEYYKSPRLPDQIWTNLLTRWRVLVKYPLLDFCYCSDMLQMSLMPVNGCRKVQMKQSGMTDHSLKVTGQ